MNLTIHALSWLLLPLVSPDGVSCPCATARVREAVSCPPDQRRLVFGVDIPSRRVFDAIRPVEPSERDANCPTCRVARDQDESCKACGLHFAHGRAYRSWAVAAIARGTPVFDEPEPEARPEQAAAQTPQPHAEEPRTGQASVAPPKPPTDEPSSEGKRCDKCLAAFEAVRKFAAQPPGRLHNEHGFEAYPWCESCRVGLVGGRMFRDRQAYDLALAADRIFKQLGTHCERCDIAALTDGECTVCGMAFHAGRMTRTRPAPDSRRP